MCQKAWNDKDTQIKAYYTQSHRLVYGSGYDSLTPTLHQCIVLSIFLLAFMSYRAKRLHDS